MSKINDGGSCAPILRKSTTISPEPGMLVGEHEYTPGMSLRDWFAGQALAGYFAAPHTPHQNCDIGEARYIYAMADAMLEARKESGAS